MAILNLLYSDRYQINDKIAAVIPSVGQILNDEDNYYRLLSIMTAMPIDMMVPLDEAGIDFTAINDYELFLLMFPNLKKADTSLFFGDLDFSKLVIDRSEQNGKFILKDKVNDIVIDRAIHGRIAAFLRKIHHLEQNRRKPANIQAKDYMLQRAKEKAKRRQKRVEDSQLEQLIIAMVNTEQYKYDFERTRELSIYQFNESVRQVIKKVDYDNRMYGIYAGTISAKDLSSDDLNWLTHK